MDIALLRKSLLQAIESARRDAAERRARADEAEPPLRAFLEETATPVFRAMASALRAEGLQFDVITPSGGVRLVPGADARGRHRAGPRRHRRSAAADRAGDAHRAAAG